jgi:hypothetical protein
MIELTKIEPRAYGSWGMVLRYEAMLYQLKKAPPILLIKQDDAKYPYRIFDGAHRFEAAKLARRTKIKAQLIGMPEAAQ